MLHSVVMGSTWITEILQAITLWLICVLISIIAFAPDSGNVPIVYAYLAAFKVRNNESDILT